MNTQQQQLIESAMNSKFSSERLQAAIAALNGMPEKSSGAGFISEKQARIYLGSISRTHLWKLSRVGLKSHRLGRRKIFKIEELEEFVMAQTGSKENV